MVQNITGAKPLTPAERKKALDKARAAGGPSFASMLEQAGAAGETAEAAPTSPAGAIGGQLSPILGDEENQPKSQQEQATVLVETLQGVAEDILSGSPTLAARKLNAYLNAAPAEGAPLSTEQQAALDEIKTRAAVTAAKLEEK